MPFCNINFRTAVLAAWAMLIGHSQLTRFHEKKKMDFYHCFYPAADSFCRFRCKALDHVKIVGADCHHEGVYYHTSGQHVFKNQGGNT